MTIQPVADFLLSGATPISGQVATPFEPVLKAFAANFERGEEVGAAFSAYVGGKPVVDIWGGHTDKAHSAAWQRDTLINVWSTTKGMAALCVALMVDRGKLDYGAPVARYWPEFAAAGKQDITVSQALSHQGGLSGLREPTTQADFYDWDTICSRLAAQEPLWEPGTANGYHAVMYGYLAGELVRRVDGRSIGQVFAEDVAEPLSLDFYIGLPEVKEPHVAPIYKAEADTTTSGGPPSDVVKLTFGNPPMNPEAPNDRAWRAAEIPGAGGQGCASSIARAYAMMANGGTLDGVTLLAPETLAKMTTMQCQRVDMVLGVECRWANGVLLNRGGAYGPNDNSYGHSGWGGSFGCADPDANLSIGYVCNQMGGQLVGDPRATSLVAALYECL